MKWLKHTVSQTVEYKQKGLWPPAYIETVAKHLLKQLNWLERNRTSMCTITCHRRWQGHNVINCGLIYTRRTIRIVHLTVIDIRSNCVVHNLLSHIMMIMVLQDILSPPVFLRYTCIRINVWLAITEAIISYFIFFNSIAQLNIRTFNLHLGNSRRKMKYFIRMKVISPFHVLVPDRWTFLQR